MRAASVERAVRAAASVALTLMLTLTLAGACKRGDDLTGSPGAAPTASPPLLASIAPATAAPVTAAHAPATACTPHKDITFFVSPKTPVAGRPLRVMALSDAPRKDALRLSRDGAELKDRATPRGGPPFSWTVELPRPASGVYRASLGDACVDVDVAAEEPTTLAARSPWIAWPVREAWSRAYEDLYAAWIERLFDAPADQQLTYSALHDVLRDPTRNLLHDYLGEGEDDAQPQRDKPVVIQPDCADLPYFLRAYFAYKMGLPFGYSSCTRGGGGQPPHCLKWHSNIEKGRGAGRDAAEAFGEFLRVNVADTVHSGTGRTRAEGDEGDYYAVKTTLESLRPGTIYADPYGHVLVVVKRAAGKDGKSGVLYAVDGQPDGTVSRRRFWRGNFLYAIDPGLGSAGFKRFRPVVMDGARPRSLGNAEILANPDYGDFSLAEYEGGVEAFYDRMDDALSPTPLDPTVALLEMIDTFEEQVKGRVVSVANGQKYLAQGGETIDMPDGPEIFETTGKWEDFSTPSRDMRLLIAIDVVTGFSARVKRRPERFAIAKGAEIEDVTRGLDERLTAELARRKFSYTRSDGSAFELSLADVVARQKGLEVAYDPNDCVEVRWAAPPGSPEARTCRRRAPGKQSADMRKHRVWFRERKRPARG
jgi:hypothetical protein